MSGADFWKPIFGNDRPVTVEIGPGRGEFLLASARAAATRNFCGIENSRRRAIEIQRKIEVAGLANALVVRADATCLIRFFPDTCVERYVLQYPDPWWKRRHYRRRIFRPDFVDNLARTLQPGGLIELTTDVEEYFALAQSLLESHQALEPVNGDARPPEGLTSFARKASASKATVLYSAHRRRPELQIIQPDCA